MSVKSSDGQANEHDSANAILILLVHASGRWRYRNENIIVLESRALTRKYPTTISKKGA